MDYREPLVLQVCAVLMVFQEFLVRRENKDQSVLPVPRVHPVLQVQLDRQDQRALQALEQVLLLRQSESVIPIAPWVELASPHKTEQFITPVMVVLLVEQLGLVVEPMPSM
jgi:hypothetical protein